MQKDKVRDTLEQVANQLSADEIVALAQGLDDLRNGRFRSLEQIDREARGMGYLFNELGIGDVFAFEHDGDRVRYRKTSQREYELAAPVVKRIGSKTAPVILIAKPNGTVIG